jgi:putative phosphoribosyl transferase
MNGFRNREDAGRRLAAELQPYAAERPIVLALPRGGVPVGYEVARALAAELDVWVVRKLGVPWHPELGVGAVAEGGYTHLTDEVLRHVGLSQDELADLVETKQREVEERVRRFRGERPAPLLRDRTVILVDDGIATGGTVRAAIHSIRAQEPKRIILAVPVAASETVAALSAEVDRVVCLLSPTDLYAIGLWYQDFQQVLDDEVVHLLDRARKERAATVEQAGSAARG